GWWRSAQVRPSEADLGPSASIAPPPRRFPSRSIAGWGHLPFASRLPQPRSDPGAGSARPGGRHWLRPVQLRGDLVTLRDAGRPGQTCGSEHPLSGCATVDWSDATSRPSVPPGGVFNNSVVLSLATGPLTLFLRGLSMAEVVVDHWDRARPVAHRCRDALHRAR